MIELWLFFFFFFCWKLVLHRCAPWLVCVGLCVPLAMSLCLRQPPLYSPRLSPRDTALLSWPLLLPASLLPLISQAFLSAPDGRQSSGCLSLAMSLLKTAVVERKFNTKNNSSCSHSGLVPCLVTSLSPHSRHDSLREAGMVLRLSRHGSASLMTLSYRKRRVLIPPSHFKTCLSSLPFLL